LEVDPTEVLPGITVEFNKSSPDVVIRQDEKILDGSKLPANEHSSIKMEEDNE